MTKLSEALKLGQTAKEMLQDGAAQAKVMQKLKLGEAALVARLALCELSSKTQDRIDNGELEGVGLACMRSLAQAGAPSPANLLEAVRACAPKKPGQSGLTLQFAQNLTPKGRKLYLEETFIDCILERKRKGMESLVWLEDILEKWCPKEAAADAELQPTLTEPESTEVEVPAEASTDTEAPDPTPVSEPAEEVPVATAPLCEEAPTAAEADRQEADDASTEPESIAQGASEEDPFEADAEPAEEPEPKPEVRTATNGYRPFPRYTPAERGVADRLDTQRPREPRTAIPRQEVARPPVRVQVSKAELRRLSTVRSLNGHDQDKGRDEAAQAELDRLFPKDQELLVRAIHPTSMRPAMVTITSPEQYVEIFKAGHFVYQGGFQGSAPTERPDHYPDPEVVAKLLGV